MEIDICEIFLSGICRTKSNHERKVYKLFMEYIIIKEVVM